jgi:hypothetical protein
VTDLATDINQIRVLLATLDERVRNIGNSMDNDRIEWNRREVAHALEVKTIRDDIDSLQLSRAKLYGGAFALSAVTSALIRVFLK